MFVKAIQKAAQFTRPLHTISRNFDSQKIIPGAATLFFINEEGYAITAKHVAELLNQSEQIAQNYQAYSDEKSKLSLDNSGIDQSKALQTKYKILEHSTIQIKNSFIDCVDKMTGFTTHLHSKYDLAILKFEGFNSLHCKEFAIFKKDTSQIQPGKFLCRLGFPFPEFTNYKYNEESDQIEWTQEGIKTSPRFPIEGMVTRFTGDVKGVINGIEMSTPGLRGQSGGPLFDENGLVCGMQSRTNHLHLGFDIENKEIMSKGQNKLVNDYSFLHLGICIHVDVIKEFLKEHQVKFYEE
jgi:hypothetical protein